MSLLILVLFCAGFYGGFTLGHRFSTLQQLIARVVAWVKQQ